MSHVKRFRFRASQLLVLLPALLVAGCSADRHPQTIFDPVTDLARTINDLQATIFWWSMLVLAVVIAALLVILVRFRARPGAPDPKRIHGNNTLEILWTLGPAIIVALILIPTVRTIFYTYDPGPEGALHVEAVGHQWWWEFRYPELGITTANQLYLPTGRPIQVTLSSADVLHNFWFPRLAGKRYTYPIPQGAENRAHENFRTMVFTIEEPGVYSGQCAEFCGEAHALMRMNLIATDEAEFEAWTETMRRPGIPGGAPAPAGPAGGPVPDSGTIVGPDRAGVEPLEDTASAPATPGQTPATAPQQASGPVDPLVQEGYDLFRTRVCAACHMVEGVSQGRLGPNLTHYGARWSVGAGVLENTQENLELWIRNPQQVKPGAKMPGQSTEGGGMPPHGLTDEQITAIAAYLLSLK